MALHGGAGENGTISGILDMCGIAYTSSNIYACAVTMDKTLSKLILKGANINVVDYEIVKKYTYFSSPNNVAENIGKHLNYPCIVKPACLGSSIGIKIANDITQLKNALNFAFDFDKDDS